MLRQDSFLFSDTFMRAVYTFGCLGFNHILDLALALSFKELSVCFIVEINGQMLARGGVFQNIILYGLSVSRRIKLFSC